MLDIAQVAADDRAMSNILTVGPIAGEQGRARLAAFGRLLALAMILTAAACTCAHAQIGSDRYSSIVMRETDGDIVSSISPDEPRFPASLTKMMTLYMVFEALRDRRIALDMDVPISVHAASMPATKLGLLPGTKVDVQQLIMGLVTKSANDGAAALGELLGGSEERFAQMMTLRARALGMSRTVFRNASGLPDPDQVSTARDLAVLARHLIDDFPDRYGYFSTPMFVFHGRMIPNHDHMLQTYPGADGIKTGYTVASGFNLVTSAVRGDVRLIGVVLGAARPAERDLHMTALLDTAYQQLGVPIAPHRDAPGRLSLIANAQSANIPATPLAASLALPLPPPPGRRPASHPARATKTGHPASPHLKGGAAKAPKPLSRSGNEAQRLSSDAG